jgi:hypothetical protein
MLPIQNELLNSFEQLGSVDQLRVVEFARSLASTWNSTGPATSGEAWLKIVGTIPPNDLAVMEEVIEEDCERIDSSEW